MFSKQKPVSKDGKDEQKDTGFQLIIKSGFGQFRPDVQNTKLTPDELKRTGPNVLKQNALIKEKDEKAELEDNKLKDVLIVVSLFAEYYEDDYLDSLTATLKNFFENPLNSFKKINIYVAGLLQRHNFWNFSQYMTDKELSSLIGDISSVAEDNIEKHVADLLAKKFWEKAIHAENYFIFQWRDLIEKNIKGSTHKLYRWDDLTPISEKAKIDEDKNIDFLKYRKVIDDEYNKEEKENIKSTSSKTERKPPLTFRQTIDTFITRIIGDVPDFANRERPIIKDPKQQKRQQLILKEASRVLNILNMPGCSPYKLAKACCLNFLLEECAGFPILTNGAWTALAYPVNKIESNFFKQTEDLMMQFGYVKRNIEWINLIYEPLRIPSQIATNIGIKHHPEAIAPTSMPLRPMPAMTPEGMEIFSLNANSESKHVSLGSIENQTISIPRVYSPTSLEEMKTFSSNAGLESKQISPATVETRSELKLNLAPMWMRKVTKCEAEPCSAPVWKCENTKRIVRSNSAPMLTSRITMEVETFKWLKKPELIINKLKYIPGGIKSWDLSLKPAIGKLDKVLDGEYKKNFIDVIQKVPFNHLKLQYIVSHFSLDSALEIFISIVNKGDVDALDLSNNELSRFDLHYLVGMFSRIKGTAVLAHNQLYAFGEKNLVSLIQSLAKVKTLDLSCNRLHLLSYEVLTNIFSNLPAELECLKIDAKCFESLSKNKLIDLIYCLPRKVVILEVTYSKKYLIEIIDKVMHVRNRECEFIDSMAEEIKNAAIRTNLLQMKSPISSFFLHGKEDKRRVKEALVKIIASKTLAEAITIVDELLSRKGATLYDDSFDTIYIRSLRMGSAKFSSTMNDILEIDEDKVSDCKESSIKLTKKDRINLKRAYRDLLKLYTWDKEDLYDDSPEPFSCYYGYKNRG